MTSNNIEMQNKKYIIYSLPTYQHTTKALEDPDPESYEENEIYELIDEITNVNECYHFRIHPNTQYTFF